MKVRGFSGDVLSVSEIFGLRPWRKRLGEFLLTFKGDETMPKSHVDLTSWNILQPKLSVMTWLGWRRADRKTPIYNLVNRTPTPLEEGWSVRVTQVLDFRGGALTYDSHNGTDFVLPIGTPVVAAAPGLVCRVCNEFNRGGLKVVVDHGHGVVTTHNHLSRALVRVGQQVQRGETIALSGSSGVDGFLLFPWSAPHLHLNTFFNGVHDDPFAAPGEQALWRHGNWPKPWQPGEEVAVDQSIEPTLWDMEAVDRLASDCIDDAIRQEIRSIKHDQVRAVTALFFQGYYPTLFRQKHQLLAKRYERLPMLDLPLQAQDFDGIYFPDGLAPLDP